MANLAKERLTPENPSFTFVGMDYFGPLYIQQGRLHVKHYSCVFTYLTTRAIHIQIMSSLDRYSFINALHLHVDSSVLGKNPLSVYRDNGSNFCTSEQEMHTAIEDWNQRTICEFFHVKDISWKFNPLYASHMNCVWERVIRSIHKILTVLLGQQLANEEMLCTLMAEVQGILKSRHLTPVSNNAKDLELLTTNHLLLLLPPGVFVKEDTYCERHWQKVQYMSDKFWKAGSRNIYQLFN